MKVIVFIAVILIVCTTMVYAQGEGCSCAVYLVPTYCGAGCNYTLPNITTCAEGLTCCIDLEATNPICQDDVGKPCSNSTNSNATCQPNCGNSSVVVTGSCTTGLQCCAPNNGGDQCNIPGGTEEKRGRYTPCKKDSTGAVIIASCQPGPKCKNNSTAVPNCQNHCPNGLTCCQDGAAIPVD